MRGQDTVLADIPQQRHGRPRKAHAAKMNGGSEMDLVIVAQKTLQEIHGIEPAHVLGQDGNEDPNQATADMRDRFGYALGAHGLGHIGKLGGELGIGAMDA